MQERKSKHSFKMVIISEMNTCVIREHQPEHVVLFDEAQRAWNLEQTSNFMRQKKGKSDFNQSEPAFLISCLDRHEDWSVVICLVGSGQEINTGEGGIGEWFDAVLRQFRSWDVYLSPKLAQAEFQGGPMLDQMLSRSNTFFDENLHLASQLCSQRDVETKHQYLIIEYGNFVVAEYIETPLPARPL